MPRSPGRLPPCGLPERQGDSRRVRAGKARGNAPRRGARLLQTDRQICVGVKQLASHRVLGLCQPQRFRQSGQPEHQRDFGHEPQVRGDGCRADEKNNVGGLTVECVKVKSFPGQSQGQAVRCCPDNPRIAGVRQGDAGRDAGIQLQLAPFLAAIVGGGVGLYAALSARNPSPAVAWTSALLPALTFVAITGFLQGSTLQVFLVVMVAYGFATLALLIPSIAAFDLLTGRT